MLRAEKAFRYYITIWLLAMIERVYNHNVMRFIYGPAEIRRLLDEVAKTREDFRKWKARGYGKKG